MKKLFSLLLIATVISAEGQISLVRSFPSTITYNFQAVYLKHSGYKFVRLHSDTLSFYNTNLSLYKDILIPGSWNLAQLEIRCISEGLFDTDTLHIDYLAENSCLCDSVVVYKDNGSVVFRENKAAFEQTTDEGMGSADYYPLISTDSGTFMILFNQSLGNATEVYKLPGSLPCIPGCSGNTNTSMPIISSKPNGAMNIYPNPAVSYSNIYYTLPTGTNEGELILYDLAGREVKKFMVTSQFDHLQLTTSDLRAGNYFYQLNVNGKDIATKKIVVVK